GSSPSTASLKAILLGNFNTCAISVSKLCDTGTANINSNTVTYPIHGAVMNIGGGSVSSLSLTDTFNNSSQTFDSGSLSCSCSSNCTITGADCSSVTLTPGGAVNYSATITTSSNGGPDIVTAQMGGTGGGSATAQSNTATCNPITFSDSISITKLCDPGAS